MSGGRFALPALRHSREYSCGVSQKQEAIQLAQFQKRDMRKQGFSSQPIVSVQRRPHQHGGGYGSFHQHVGFSFPDQGNRFLADKPLVRFMDDGEIVQRKLAVFGKPADPGSIADQKGFGDPGLMCRPDRPKHLQIMSACYSQRMFFSEVAAVINSSMFRIKKPTSLLQ